MTRIEAKNRSFPRGAHTIFKLRAMLPTSNRTRVVVILNPRAGRGLGAKWHHTLSTKQPDWEVWPTTFAGEATILARRAVDEGADLIIAAGGDGTLGEVLNGVFGTPTKLSSTKLGVLPLGTGNDFARGLGIKNLRIALDVLRVGRTRFVDCGRACFPRETRLWLNIAGTGFDSRVANRINQNKPAILKRLRGPLAYLVAAGAEVRELQSFDLKITLDEGFVDERILRRRALLCAVANAQSYGGGMRVAPNAFVDDGLFDICLINNASRTEFARAFPSVFAGKHLSHSKVEMFRARTVKVESEPSLPVLIDGEIAGTTPVRFEMLGRSVEFVAP